MDQLGVIVGVGCETAGGLVRQDYCAIIRTARRSDNNFPMIILKQKFRHT